MPKILAPTTSVCCFDYYLGDDENPDYRVELRGRRRARIWAGVGNLRRSRMCCGRCVRGTG